MSSGGESTVSSYLGSALRMYKGGPILQRITAILHVTILQQSNTDAICPQGVTDLGLGSFWPERHQTRVSRKSPNNQAYRIRMAVFSPCIQTDIIFPERNPSYLFTRILNFIRPLLTHSSSLCPSVS